MFGIDIQFIIDPSFYFLMLCTMTTDIELHDTYCYFCEIMPCPQHWQQHLCDL